MPNDGSGVILVLRSLRLAQSAMTLRWMTVVVGALLAGEGAAAAAGDKNDVVRDLADRVGPIVGSALACRDIARPRIQVIVDKFTAVIAEASSNEAERSEITQLLDRSVADGRGAVTSGQMDCGLADRQLAGSNSNNISGIAQKRAVACTDDAF